jgi:two-component system cell cycle sensor histidine kinase/response regulator CckA
MEERSFGFAIEALQQQLAEMSRRAAEEPSQLTDVLADSLQELLGTMEELKIARKELQQQGEELSAAQQALEAERRRYRNFFEFIPYGCLVTDTAGVIKEANQAVAAMLCVGQDYLIGKSLITFIAAKSRQTLNNQILKFEEGEMEQEEKVQEWKLRLKPLGRPTFPAAITVAGLSALPSSSGLSALPSSSGLSALPSSSGLSALPSSSGISALPSSSGLSALPSSSALSALPSSSALSALPSSSALSALPSSSGLSALPSSPQTEPSDLCWLIRNITEPRQANAILQGNEDRYHLFFEEDLTGEFISTPDGQILACNPAFARILGFASVEEAMGCNLESLYPDHKMRDAYLALLQREKKIEYRETELYRRDGQPVQLIEKAIGTFDAQGRLIEIKGYLFDITERKGLEEQLRQSQKMEAIRRLSNRIAHDFNNLLVGIRGYSDLLLYHLDSRDPLRKDIEEIRKAGDRATSLTQQLLIFSRKQIYQSQMVDLSTVISGMDIQSLIGEEVRLTLSCGSGLGLVKADHCHIEQIITNLVVNACEAMPQGGDLIIRIANIHLDESYARQHVGVQAGPYVMLLVSDSGTGMDEETQSHLFEPFFTTKRQERQRGLSLSTVYGVVQQSGGHISVSSRVGQGTTFKIYLPRIVTREPQNLSASINGSSRLIHRRQKGSETVLLVEDEESVRTAIYAILKKFGYTVLEAHQAEEAMMICKQHQGPIHLMLTDMSMPRMNGLDLAHHLKSLRPEMKVIFMSGNLNIIADQQHAPEPQMNLLPKPFVLNDLVSRVRQVLDEDGGSGSSGKEQESVVSG